MRVDKVSEKAKSVSSALGLRVEDRGAKVPSVGSKVFSRCHSTLGFPFGFEQRPADSQTDYPRWLSLIEKHANLNNPHLPSTNIVKCMQMQA